jgi:hypothetical protein
VPISVDSAGTFRDLKGLDKLVDNAWRETGRHFREITPRKSGNAQRNTLYNSGTKTISAEYPYGAVLDDGRSKQATQGMSNPSFDFFDASLDRIFR